MHPHMQLSNRLHSRLLLSSLNALLCTSQSLDVHFYAHLSFECLQLHICTNNCFWYTFELILFYFYSLSCMQRPHFLQTSFYYLTNTTGFHSNYTWTCILGSACSHCVTKQKKRGHEKTHTSRRAILSMPVWSVWSRLFSFIIPNLITIVPCALHKIWNHLEGLQEWVSEC